MNFFDISTAVFTVFGYPVSCIELVAVLSGLISVYYAARVNTATWPTGIVNELFLFLLFFQMQLYADMFLQVYFFIVTLWGWYSWRAGRNEEKISRLPQRMRLILLAAVVTGTVISGYIFSNIHTWLPQFFLLKASFPFTDSFIMVSSIVATVLLARRKIETWLLWIAVDVVCVVLYYVKGTLFLSAEYFIFLVLASYGLYHWRKNVKHG